MEYRILRELPGRMRLDLAGPVPPGDVDAFNRALIACSVIRKVQIYPRIGALTLTYDSGDAHRSTLLSHLDSIDAQTIEKLRASSLSHASRSHDILMDLALLVSAYFMKRIFLPKSLLTLVSLIKYLRFLRPAIRSLLRLRLNVPVLDASAIGISFIKADPTTAGQTMLLLDIGETLENYTRSRSEGALIDALLDLPETAQLLVDDDEVQVNASDLKLDDVIVVRTGMPVCVDGEIIEGTAMINQAALTGEPLAVERSKGDRVFAGTVVEDGEAKICVKANSGDTKLRSIVSMVQQSESFKSQAQSRMEHLADSIVPWNFLLAGIVALTTKSLIKTSAALMVDYSCALKLTGSIAVLSAMSQSAREGFTVKGSKYFEAFAAADTIVFDKTGTLTESVPKLACVVAFDGWEEDEVLRLSACLEEHFPHPVARAVVRAAAERNLQHRERHAAVEYIVAHGIASSLDGKRVIIGSEHFVVEDEAIQISEEQHKVIVERTGAFSPLYLAVDGELAGVLGIEDPLKEGVVADIADLRSLGFKRIIMLTGDNHRTAERVAVQAGLSEFHANLLPEDKFSFVKQLKEEGCKVVMVGDGVNDAPALSLADVGIAMGQGTAVAKEVADVTLTGGDLSSIVSLRRMSSGLMKRLDTSFKEVMIVNSGLLAAGILGIITPQVSSFMHNASTIALSARNSANYEVKR